MVLVQTILITINYLLNFKQHHEKVFDLIISRMLYNCSDCINNTRKNSSERKAGYLKLNDIKGERNQNPVQVKENIQRKKPVARRRKE